MYVFAVQIHCRLTKPVCGSSALILRLSEREIRQKGFRSMLADLLTYLSGQSNDVYYVLRK